MTEPIGHVDGLIGRYVDGWAVPSDDRANCLIEVLDGDGRVLGRGRAQRTRDDLVGLDLGRVDFGFRIALDSIAASSSLRVVADGLELPNSPLPLGDAITDGHFSIREDRAVGWVCRRGDPDLPITVTLRTVDGLALFSFDTARNEFDTDPNFQPYRFDVELPDDFFGRQDLQVEASVDGRVFATASGKLRVLGYIDRIAPEHCAGWLLSPDAPDRALRLEIRRDGVKLGTVLCNRERGDLKEAFPDNWSRGFHLGFPQATGDADQLMELSIRFPGSGVDLLDGPFIAGTKAAFVAAGKRIAALTQRDSGRLRGPELGLLQNIMQDYLGQCRQGAEFVWRSALAASAAHPGRPITILIPIYKGIEITESCIRSVLANYGPRDTILLVADCPPESGMQAMLGRFRKGDRVVLLNNPTNMGFIGSVNRGLEFCKTDDILLLNSDTFVHAGGIEMMRKILHDSDDIASVTALSNNATIFSYPHPTLASTTLDDIGWSELAAVALATNNDETVDVPTGHGFCMLVRREVLDRLKSLNEVFGRGYGEENELCLRASDLGFRHVAATGVLVEHRESVSFGADKEELIRRNLATLGGMYPEYTPTIMHFEANDPLRVGRWHLDIARLRRARSKADRFVLVIENWLGGGTVKAADDIARLVGYDDRTELKLACDRNGVMTLSCSAPMLRAVFTKDDASPLLAVLDAAEVELVVIHQLLGYAQPAITALTRWVRGRTAVFFGHDFYAMCPRVTFIDAAQRFCGAAAPDICTRCRAFGHDHEASLLTELDTAEHRALFGNLLRAVSKVIVPSESAARYYAKFFPDAHIVTIPHPDAHTTRASPVRRGRSDNVILLGGIGPHKGSKQLLEIASQARLTHQHLTFTVIGHTDRDEAFKELGNVEILGRYDPEKLPRLLDKVGGRIALFTSCWPETFSYTLSEAVHAGLVPMVPDIGAPAERVRAASYGVVFPFPIEAASVLDAITSFDYDAVIPEDASASYTNPESVLRLRRAFVAEAPAAAELAAAAKRPRRATPARRPEPVATI